MLTIDLTTLGVVLPNDCDFGAKKLTVIALVAQTTVETALGLASGKAGTDLEIYFGKGLEPLCTQEPGLTDTGGKAKIIRIEVVVRNDTMVALLSGPTQIGFH